MTKKPYPSDKLDQYIVRFPDGLRDRIKAAAEENKRSMNAEIVARLESSFDEDVPGADGALYILLDTNGEVTSWGEIEAHMMEIIEKAKLKPTSIRMEVLPGKLVSTMDRKEQMLRLWKKYRSAGRRDAMGDD